MPEYQDPVARDALRQVRNELRRQQAQIAKLQSMMGAPLMSRGSHTTVPNPYDGMVMIGLDSVPRYYSNGAWREFAALARWNIKVISDTKVVATGDGKIIHAVDSDMNGMNLVAVAAYVTTVSSSGAVTVQLRNITQTADMLSTKITIDASEFTSHTAATAAVIDTSNDDVATGDLIAVDVDGAGTGAKGLGVTCVFGKP